MRLLIAGREPNIVKQFIIVEASVVRIVSTHVLRYVSPDGLRTCCIPEHQRALIGGRLLTWCYVQKATR